jgi:hypothetical protein
VIEMGLHGFIEGQPALFHRPEEGQAPPRGLHLVEGLLIRGTNREATGAPDAGQQRLILRPLRQRYLLAGDWLKETMQVAHFTSHGLMDDSSHNSYDFTPRF